MDKLEKQIQEFIIRTDKQAWNVWYEQVKQGKIVIPEYNYQGEAEKDEGA